MEFKDLIIDIEEPSKATSKRKPSTKATINYEVVLQSGCDFAVRRKTAKTSKLLVMLVSQGQFYIKDEKTDKIEKLNPENYTAFKMDLEKPLSLDNVNWIDTFEKRLARTSLNNAAILRLVINDDFKQLAKKGLIKIDSNFIPDAEELKTVTNNLQIYKYIYENYRDKAYFYRLFNYLTVQFNYNKECKKFSFADTTTYRYGHPSNIMSWMDILSKMADIFGLDNTKKLIDLLISKTDASDIQSCLSIIYSIVRPDNGIVFKFKDFYNYLDYAPIYNGFLRYRQFLEIYKDTLKLECLLYDKIKDKYPKSIMLTHDQCSYQYHFKKLLIDEKNFAKATKEAERFEWGNKDYKIMIPKTAEDITEEAIQQGNCLKTYIEKVANGQCYIVFLRKKKSIEKSYISIEINGNRVVQVEGTNHRRYFSEEEYEVMENWAKEKKLALDFGKYSGRAVA